MQTCKNIDCFYIRHFPFFVHKIMSLYNGMKPMLVILYNFWLFFLFFLSVGLKTQPESKCPELLANYCDMLLRKTPLSKKLTSEEIEAKLKEVVCSFFCF